MAEDDKAVGITRGQSHTQRSISSRVTGTRANDAIAARNVTAKRVRRRTHIVPVHVKILQERLLEIKPQAVSWGLSGASISR